MIKVFETTTKQFEEHKDNLNVAIVRRWIDDINSVSVNELKCNYSDAKTSALKNRIYDTALECSRFAYLAAVVKRPDEFESLFKSCVYWVSEHMKFESAPKHELLFDVMGRKLIKNSGE